MKRFFIFAVVLALMISTVSFAPISASAETKTYKPLETVVYGDSNKDGEVNAKDVLLVRKHLAKWKVEVDALRSDCNADDAIDAKDVLLLRKYLAKWSVTLGHNYESTKQTFKDVSDKLTLYGRCGYSLTTLRADFTGSGFEFKADCEGTAEMRMKIAISGGNIGIVVDGDYDNMNVMFVEPSMTRIVLAEGLEKGIHTFRIYKLNEFGIYYIGNHITFRNITINGRFLKADEPDEDQLKIEFYGDSITCGYGNLYPQNSNGPHDNINQDGMKTYATYTARKLNAQYSICAGSGYGIYCGNGGSTDQRIGKIMDSKFFPDDGDDKDAAVWDYSFDADLVVITLGTNDNSFSKVGNAISYDNLMMRAKELVDKIREHNPDCYIIWLGGIMGKMSNAYADIDTVITDLAAKTDNMIFYGDMPFSNGGGDGHPTAAQHEKVSEILVQLIKDNFGKELGLVE